MTQINAKIIADSKNEYGNRITTMVVTFPRYILAELNTHRMLSKNSASSRAIPTKKMLKSVMNNPFIPIAWQKDHAGMQGTEYFSNEEKFHVLDIKDIMLDRLRKIYDGEDVDPEIMEMFERILLQFTEAMTLNQFWLKVRDKAVEAVILFYCFGVTKQIVNRMLEPFANHTVIITATELENFFALRCPKYTLNDYNEQDELVETQVFRNRKTIIEKFPNWYIKEDDSKRFGKFPKDLSEIEWLILNTGQADIHMMALAEAMWDAYNESTPKELKAGEWHKPFGDTFEKTTLANLVRNNLCKDGEEASLKIATARCARISYTVVGDEGKEANYENDIKLHDRLSASGHWSPFEHCAKAMETEECNARLFHPEYNGAHTKNDGWIGNFKGFVQYRKMFNNENIK
jgi:hypothetical protein